MAVYYVIVGNTVTFDARVASTLIYNELVSSCTIFWTVDVTRMVVRFNLLSALTHTGTFTLTRGTLDLNGNTLTCGSFSSR